MYFLKRGKFLAHYVSAEDRYYPNDFKDPGYWITSGTNVHVHSGYNTRAVSRDKLPKRWEDTANPRVEGENAPQPREQWFAWILQIMGKENGLNSLRALAKQSLAIRRESNAMRAQLITAGEADLEIDSTFSVITPLMKNGAPVGWTTLGPYPVVPVAHALAARAPHPNAANFSIDFVLSREGQRIVLASERNSARADLAQEQSAIERVKLIPLDPSQGDNLEFYARQASRSFGK